MEKIRSSPLSFVFPWLAPLVITFALVNGGVEIQLYRNNRLLKNWQPSILRQIVPESLLQWIDDNHIHKGLQPYPLVKQFWHALLPLASKKLVIDASALAALEEISQPQDFALVWSLNCSLARIEGHYEGIDHYLGMGWFQKGTKVWSLAQMILAPSFPPFENLLLPLRQAHSLLHMTIPYMQHFLPARADFQLITDFAPQITVLNVHSRGLTLALQCNYPQLMPIVHIPRRETDVLLAKQALIQFPHHALTPVLAQLLQNGSSVTIQGTDIPLVISEQLPLMRRYRQISDASAEKILQAHPILPIASLKPTLAFSHRRENGIGTYAITTTYLYQQQALDIDAMLAAYQQRQRFVQQYAIWFEWPSDAYGLVNTIQQQRIPQVLRPAEVMGFDTRRTALVPGQLPAHAIQVGGNTPVERAQALFKQLQYHGIPGGIVGEPKGLLTMFAYACENLLHDNQQARILWLAPSPKKGSVTRAVHASSISSYVTVASLVTLRDEPALLSRSWTLIILQEWDVLLDGTPQSRGLFYLQSRWVLTSVTSKQALNSAIMQALHLPEHYYDQFCARYLFDLESAPLNTALSPRVPAPMASPAMPEKVKFAPSALPEKAKPIPAIQTPQRVPEIKQHIALPSTRPGATPPARPVPEQPEPKPAPRRHAIELDQQKIARLHEENEHILERLTVEDEEEQEQLFIPPPAPVEPVVSQVAASAPDVDEDWQTILQQWQPEHWEIIRLLCQGKSVQLTTAERKNHRPVSRLIDEINAPVEEQLGDLLVDAAAQTLFPHLREFTENLVHWYDSSKGR